MLKKIIYFVILGLLLIPVCFAEEVAEPVPVPPPVVEPPMTVIGIFLEAPLTYASNETVRKIVPEKATSLFPKFRFKVLPMDQTMLELRTYMEDNRMIVNQYYLEPLNRFDIQKISQGLGCNYALFITINNDMPRIGSGLFSISFKTTVTCDIRLLDVETGKYLISKQIVKDGKSTAVYAGVPSFDRAYNDALGKALDELTIDTTVLK